MADARLADLDHEGVEIESRLARVGAAFDDDPDRAFLGLVELVRKGAPWGVALEVSGAGDSCEAGATLVP